MTLKISRASFIDMHTVSGRKNHWRPPIFFLMMALSILDLMVGEFRDVRSCGPCCKKKLKSSGYNLSSTIT